MCSAFFCAWIHVYKTAPEFYMQTISEMIVVLLLESWSCFWWIARREPKSAMTLMNLSVMFLAFQMPTWDCQFLMETLLLHVNGVCWKENTKKPYRHSRQPHFLDCIYSLLRFIGHFILHASSFLLLLRLYLSMAVTERNVSSCRVHISTMYYC